MRESRFCAQETRRPRAWRVVAQPDPGDASIARKCVETWASDTAGDPFARGILTSGPAVQASGRGAAPRRGPSSAYGGRLAALGPSDQSRRTGAIVARPFGGAPRYQVPPSTTLRGDGGAAGRRAARCLPCEVPALGRTPAGPRGSCQDAGAARSSIARGTALRSRACGPRRAIIRGRGGPSSGQRDPPGAARSWCGGLGLRPGSGGRQACASRAPDPGTVPPSRDSGHAANLRAGARCPQGPDRLARQSRVVREPRVPRCSKARRRGRVLLQDRRAGCASGRSPTPQLLGTAAKRGRARPGGGRSARGSAPPPSGADARPRSSPAAPSRSAAPAGASAAPPPPAAPGRPPA